MNRLSAAARALASGSALLAPILLLCSPAEARDLRDELLESKYKWGDYGVMAGWYDPNGQQFEEHANFALPIGLKVRFKWLQWFRVEGELSYYRRSSAPSTNLTLVAAPAFEGFYVASSFQTVLLRGGPVRPYALAGIMAASLRNDFVTAIAAVPDSVIDRFQLASWGKWDVGFHVGGGIDFPLGYRVFPFAEFRYLFGEIELDEIRIGAFPFKPEELETADGQPLANKYDWGGPQIVAGLKILF